MKICQDGCNKREDLTKKEEYFEGLFPVWWFSKTI